MTPKMVQKSSDFHEKSKIFATRKFYRIPSKSWNFRKSIIFWQNQKCTVRKLTIHFSPLIVPIFRRTVLRDYLVDFNIFWCFLHLILEIRTLWWFPRRWRVNGPSIECQQNVWSDKEVSSQKSSWRLRFGLEKPFQGCRESVNGIFSLLVIGREKLLEGFR